MDKIHYDHVSKTYPSESAVPFPAVHDVTFSVPDGQLIVFLGPSGCGKTTLLKMTNRLIEPSAGTIYLGGVDIREVDVTGLRRKIGYVIQQVGLFPHMTVAQNVAVVPELLQWPKQRIAARVDELLDLVHLSPEEFRGRYPAQLSGGQQQRVGLARALAGDPDVLLMDEPFGAIDAITRASLQGEILQLQARLHKTILFVTHDVDEALRLADRIVVLRSGKLLQYGDPCSLLGHPANEFVAELMGADDRIRALSLQQAADAMQPIQIEQTVPSPGMAMRNIPTGSNLRQALSLMLEPRVDQLIVLAEDGHAVGILTLEDIRRSVCAETSPIANKQNIPENIISRPRNELSD